MKAKYINPFTDFGFKKIFGEEASKPLLIDFLNALLPPENKIADLSFRKVDNAGHIISSCNGVYEINCLNQNRQSFVVELQKAEQNFFGKRVNYYASFPGSEQVKEGIEIGDFKTLYCIGLLNFSFSNYESNPTCKEAVQFVTLKDQADLVITHIYVETPKFNKALNDLSTRLDKWLYFLKNLEDFESIPTIFQDEIFIKAFESTSLAEFRLAGWEKYEASLKIFRDNNAVFEYAKQKGYKEGREAALAKMEAVAEKKRIAKALRESDVPINIIAKSTGLLEDEIAQL